MSNHVHILLETEKANLGEAMRLLNWQYTAYFNKTHKLSGHLFESRYKCKLVQREKYFLALVRYIHLNPVKANISKAVSDYSWSSHAEYVRQDKNAISDWKAALGHFNENNVRAIVCYYEFLGRRIPKREWKQLSRIGSGVLGDPLFRKRYGLN